MWRQLKFRNFKSLRDVNLDLERLTVLVGPNGAGKSSVLNGVRQLSELTTELPTGHDAAYRIRERYRLVGPLSPEQLRTRGVDDSEYLSLGASVVPGAWKRPSDDVCLRMRRAPTTEADRTPYVWVSLNGSTTAITHLKSGEAAQADSLAHELARAGHGPAIELALSGEALARPSVLDGEVVKLGRDGYGLASMLAAMAATDRERISRLEADLSKVVPRARRIRTPPKNVVRNETQIISVSGKEHAVDTPREIPGHRLEIEMEGAGFLDASLVSDGTLIALGILALLHSETCPKLVLIDDLDHSLHPTAHRALVDSLRAILLERPDLQILCTTHAPYLLDHFEPEEIRVLSLDDQGHTRARKLLDHPEWSEALRGLSTGEFWSSVGEQWVAANGDG